MVIISAKEYLTHYHRVNGRLTVGYASVTKILSAPGVVSAYEISMLRNH
ncbi:MAG: hypothetical protein J0H29_13620 [Sphingobacteriales bacterium]|nr:hypothetical protein [Sphingobacteriales bacterium]